MRTIKRLSEKQEKELFERFQKHNDQKARSKLIKAKMPLARDIASRFVRRGEPLEDLMQVGYIGLMKAIDQFDLGRGVKFYTYATAKISGEIRNYLRDDARSLGVPRSLKDLATGIHYARQQLTMYGIDSPSIVQIADVIGVSPDMVHKAVIALRTPDSIDGCWENESGELPSLLETVPLYDSGYENVAFWSLIGPELYRLKQPEREVLYRRFFEDLTQQEIAEKMGISQMHVSRHMLKALSKLRERLRLVWGVYAEGAEP